MMRGHRERGRSRDESDFWILGLHGRRMVVLRMQEDQVCGSEGAPGMGAVMPMRHLGGEHNAQ